MSEISTFDNALDSVRRMAKELPTGGANPLALKGALWWGWHAVLALAHHRLRPARDTFDHWFWDYLESGAPKLHLERDAWWEERQRLTLLELIDILSEEDLTILKPEFYQGWQDRTTRCRTLRSRVAEVLGAAVGGELRQRLLLLLAAYHRLLRLPAAVEIDGATVAAQLPALADLLEMLVDRTHDHAPAMLEAIASCRRQVP